MHASTRPQVRAAPRTRRPAAVILDMDGLMLDTEPLAARAWQDAAAIAGIDFDPAVTARLIGRTFSDCRGVLHEHHGDDYPVDDLMRAWGDAYDAIVAREGVRLKPGLLELLAWLDKHDVRKAVATSTRRSRAQGKLSSVGLLHRFPALVGGDEIGRGKPAPDIFIEAAARLGVGAEDCAVVEDSEPGVRAAVAAGMTAIMVPDLHPPSVAILALQPVVLSTLHEVRVHLAALPPAIACDSDAASLQS